MKVTDLDPGHPLRTIQYHDRLNPALWKGNKLRPRIEKHLKKIANEFIEFLKIPDINVIDIILTGSSVGYNWTKQSDIDLHVILDLTQIRQDCPDLINEYLQAKKKVWNDTRNITIHGINVELYAQDKDEPHVSPGEYSVMRNEWVSQPKREQPKLNHRAVMAKLRYMIHLITEVFPCNRVEESEKVKEKIRLMRRAGLQREGEYRIENITFKILRNLGYLEQLAQCNAAARDKELSLG